MPWEIVAIKASLKEAVKGVDLVIHSAGVTRAVKEETFFHVNADGTGNLIQACLENAPHLRRFIYLSSQAAAGPSRDGTRKRETDSCEPVSAYGRSKRMGEEMALAHGRHFRWSSFDPLRSTGREIKISMSSSSSSQEGLILAFPIRLSASASVMSRIWSRRSSLPLRIRALQGEIFFVSDGQDYPIEEIGNAFARAMEIDAFRLCIPKWVLLGIASFSEYFSQVSGKPSLISKGKVEEMVQKNWVCDITKMKTILGFNPSISLTDGARLTVNWYRNKKWL